MTDFIAKTVITIGCLILTPGTGFFRSMIGVLFLLAGIELLIYAIEQKKSK